MLLTLVDCQWSDWVTADCSATCGGGNRTKTRTKIVEEMYGGTCEGGSEAVEDCSTHGCPGMFIRYNYRDFRFYT